MEGWVVGTREGECKYLVAEPGGAVHHESARGVGRGAHALRHGDAEFEFGAENDGEGEGEAV